MINTPRCAICAFLMLLLHIAPPVLALDTTQVDLVREKEVLYTADFGIIDAFVDEAIQEFLQVTDFSSISVIRSTILSRSSSEKSSAEEQFAQQFFSSAAKYLKVAFEKTREFSSQHRAEQMRLNLMILLDNMEDLQLAKLAAEMLDEQNTAVRYWVVHAVTNPVIAAKLNTAAEENPDMVGQIVRKLEDRLTKESSPEILSLIIDFAGNLKRPQGRELLLAIADKRIQEYENWTVDNELLDNAVLVNLCGAIASQREGKAEMARRFAQLYSFAMQRYIQSINNNTLLDSTQKQQLASVLVDVEQKCIGKLTEITQSAIRSAVERDRSAALLAEHNSLFGSENNIGRLVRALDFDYGQNPDGTRRLIPRILPPRS